jgi:SNF2 family DNA or RNA helicase
MNINKKQEFGVLLEQSFFNDLKVSPYNGEKVISEYSPLVPYDFRHVIKKSLLYGTIEDDLLKYLEKHEIPFPFYLRTDSGIITVKWDSKYIFKRKTILKLVEEKVSLIRGGEYDKSVNSNLYLLGKTLVADVENRRLGVIAPSDAWKVWYFFHELCKSEADKPLLMKSKKTKKRSSVFVSKTFSSLSLNQDRIQIEAEKFNRQFIPSLNEKQKDIILLNDSPTQSPLKERDISDITSEAKYKILITREKYSVYISLTPKIFIGDISFYPNKELLKLFYVELGELPPKTKKKILKHLIKNNFEFPKSDEIDGLIEKDIKNKELSKEKIDTIFNKLNLLLSKKQTRYLAIENKWCKISTELKNDAALICIPQQYFENDIFYQKENPFEIRVKNNKFNSYIEKLQKQLTKYNIELVFEEKPVEVVHWDFKIETEKEDQSFNLNPIITTEDGQQVDIHYLETINMDSGIMMSDNKVKILDDSSRQIIKELLLLMPEKRGTDSSDKKNVHIPRLQILDWLYLRKFGVELSLFKEEQALFNKLVGFEKIEEFEVPQSFIGNLRQYQKDGYNWLYFLYNHRLGACLADDMGLGKTIQVLAFLAEINERLAKQKEKNSSEPTLHLIIVPPSIVFNWQKEINTFCPHFKVLEYIGIERKIDFKDIDIVITTYDIIRRDIEELKKYNFHVIVFDEVQILKNNMAERTIAAKQLNGRFKVCLSGTPFENHIGEYFSIINIALPGLLENAFSNKINQQSDEFLDIIIKRTKPFVLRRTKKEILHDLPAKTETDVYLDFSEKQKEIYYLFLEEVKQRIADAYNKKTPAQAQIIALTSILRLRQICLSPRLIDERFRDDYPKVTYLIRKLIELQEEGHSALIFSQFKSYLDIIEEYLNETNIPFARIDGSTPIHKRKKIISDFQSNDTPSLLLMTLKTGGFGLNLTKASYVFHMDPWWNPTTEDQASDRVHRWGQTRKVFIQRILMHSSIEEKIMLLKKRKKEMFNRLLEDGINRKNKPILSKDDFDFLLK